LSSRLRSRLLVITDRSATHGRPLRDVVRAAHAGCDFVLFGPVYATPAKAAFGPPQGIERLREASSRGIATFAVGGLTAANAAAALATGAYGVAAIREVMSAADPQEAVRALLAALGETRAP
jgi:thiamine-phosphate pyrophosphorylase